MRSAGAARRREQEQEQEPPAAGAAAAGAELRRVLAEADAALRRMSRRDREIESIAARLLEMGSACGNAELFAALADRLATRQSLQVVETISCADHITRARETAGLLASAVTYSRVMADAHIAEGRRREAGERDRAGRAPGPRHAGRGRHLRLAGGAAAKAGIVAAAASVAAGTVIAGHDSASVHRWASPPSPAAVRLHLGRPDTAVRVPQAPVSPSPRPSAASQAASPVPVPVPPPGAPATSSPAAPPPSSAPAPGPALDVQRILDLGASIRGILTLTARGGAVTWTARGTDGITLSAGAGVALPGQPVTLQVTDPSGAGGWVYISAGQQAWAVEVTSAAGTPGGL